MYDIKEVNGHIEVYFNGRFLCSADNIYEALHDVEAHQRGDF